MKIPKKLNKIIGKLVNAVTNSVSQTSSKNSGAFSPPAPGIDEACRKAADEAIVLLKNDNNVLPVSKDRRVSVFGRVQYDTFLLATAPAAT